MNQRDARVPSTHSFGLDSDDIQSTNSFEIERSDLKEYLDAESCTQNKWVAVDNFSSNLKRIPFLPIYTQHLQSNNPIQPDQKNKISTFEKFPSHFAGLNFHNSNPDSTRNFKKYYLENQALQAKMISESNKLNSLISKLREELRQSIEENEQKQHQISELNTQIIESLKREEFAIESTKKLKQELTNALDDIQQQKSQLEQLRQEITSLKEISEPSITMTEHLKSIMNMNSNSNLSNLAYPTTIQNPINSNCINRNSNLNKTSNYYSNSNLTSTSKTNITKVQAPNEKEPQIWLIPSKQKNNTSHSLQHSQSTKNIMQKMLERNHEYLPHSLQQQSCQLTSDISMQRIEAQSQVQKMDISSISNSKLEKSGQLLDESFMGYGCKQNLEKFKKLNSSQNSQMAKVISPKEAKKLNLQRSNFVGQESNHSILHEKSMSHRSDTKNTVNFFDQELWSNNQNSASTKASAQSPSTFFRSPSPVKVQNFFECTQGNQTIFQQKFVDNGLNELSQGSFENRPGENSTLLKVQQNFHNLLSKSLLKHSNQNHSSVSSTDYGLSVGGAIEGGNSLTNVSIDFQRMQSQRNSKEAKKQTSQFPDNSLCSNKSSFIGYKSAHLSDPSKLSFHNSSNQSHGQLNSISSTIISKLPQRAIIQSQIEAQINNNNISSNSNKREKNSDLINTMCKSQDLVRSPSDKIQSTETKHHVKSLTHIKQYHPPPPPPSIGFAGKKQPEEKDIRQKKIIYDPMKTVEYQPQKEILKDKIKTGSGVPFNIANRNPGNQIKKANFVFLAEQQAFSARSLVENKRKDPNRFVQNLSCFEQPSHYAPLGRTRTKESNQ